MKKIVLLFFALGTQLYAQWHWQTPAPQGNSIYDMKKINSSTLIAIGAGTTILRSANNGISWTQQLSVSDTLNARLQGIYFLNDNTGWVVGSHYLGFSKTVILKTTDAGVTWNYATNGANAKLLAIQFYNSSIGYTVGEAGKIFRTTNGGTSWIAATSGTSNNLHAVWAVSDSVAFAFGIGGAFKTTNQGATWASTPLNGSYPNVRKSYFFNNDSGYIVGQSGAMMKTTDKGITWTSISTGSSSATYSFVYFLDGLNGWMVRDGSAMRRTTNGGQTWLASTYSPDIFPSMFSPVPRLSAIYFPDSQNGIAFDVNGLQYTTTDGGAMWSAVTSLPSVDMYQTYFVDKNNGYAVGDGELILKTTNGGGTWSKRKYSGSQLSYESLFFTSAQNGWVAGEGGILAKTTDGGSSWNSQTSQVFGRIKSIYFNNANTGWLCSDNGGGIARTTNGGETWVKSTISNLSGASLYKIIVPDGKTGYAQGDGQSIFKTIDSGATWTRLTNITTAASMSVLDTNTIFVSTSTDSVYKSTNGGAAWSPVAKNNIYRTMQYIHFMNENDGYGIGWGSTANLVSRTRDGGKTWVSEKAPNGEGDFVHIFVIDSSNAWISSGDGIILGKTPSIATSITARDDQTPSTFFLSQNYPNPFNPSTTIRYQVREAGMVSLRVYDAIGREVAMLVNGRAEAGSYAVSFSGAELPSGMYLYRLQSSAGTEVRKMLLMK